MAISAFIVGRDGDPGLLGSYGRALRSLGVEANYWDIGAAIQRHTRFGRAGRFVSSYFPVEPWTVKANRDLILAVAERKPSFLLFAGAAPVRTGALAQIRASSPSTRIVLIWPDTLLNLADHIAQLLPLCDLVVSYSSTACPILERLGARRTTWLPFAADPQLFPASPNLTPEEKAKYGCDVAFVGNHRPEREAAVLALLDAGLDVKVWGVNDWERHASQPKRVASYYRGGPIFGSDLSKAVCAARLALNVIDPTNFPAANMRFFELYACGAVAFSSRCPEMEATFPDGVAGIYYDADPVGRAKEALADEALCERVRKEGHARAQAGHTYADRARALLQALELS